MNPIIKVQNISKQYQIGAWNGTRQSLSEVFTSTLRAPVRRLRERREARRRTIWALKDVSFEVEAGEVVGFIGPNGAGKSTLLKLLSRITEPTSGRVEIYGHVGSLLEVGTGFHPELTGRENIYLNGAILGMKRELINRKFDEIVAFSEIAKFIDTAVKFYSTGMYMRLAFAVAAHLDPEILIVDEVLAVGDAQFQKKCLRKMGEVSKTGRTVLFVSHNSVAVQSLCKRAIWLNEGKIVDEGQPSDVLAKYFRSTSPDAGVAEETWKDPESAPGNSVARLHSIRVTSSDNDPASPLTMKTPFTIDIEYWNLTPNAELHITIHLYTSQEIVAFATGDRLDSPWRNRGMPAGLYRSKCHIPGEFLNAGLHQLTVFIVQDKSSVICQYRSKVSFEIVDLEEREGSWFGREPGVVAPTLQWTTTRVLDESGQQVSDRS